tara:strand:+ start:813 stop:1328 length:516 start_codon:yes stop_codon:yes gene_type:complete
MKFLEIRKLIKSFINNNKISSSNKENKTVNDEYLELSILLKDSRNNRNITQKDLAKISKIPISIIIAIENNEKDLIPEYPFIRSILLKLEECLKLKKFKLVNLIKQDRDSRGKQIKINYLINKLDLLNSWQGNFLYILILLLSLLVLNNYFINSKTIEFKFIDNKISKINF